MFATVPLSRIISWESWFIFNLHKNKQVSRTPSTLTLCSFWLTFSRQFTTYYCISHSYILEQLSSGAPREWVHLGLVLGKDCLPFRVVGLCCPPWLGLPQFLLSTSCLFLRFIHHTFKSPYNYYTSLKTSTHIGIMVARHDIFTHIHDLQPFFLLFFLTYRQVSWPQTLMSGTVRCMLIFTYLLSFIHILLQEIDGVTLLICVISSTAFSKLIQNNLYIKRSCSKFVIDPK